MVLKLKFVRQPKHYAKQNMSSKFYQRKFNEAKT